ncbi:MAG: MYXO-CTERM domain-containing protein [Cognaticolwellia sp.]|jgi:MYXO-CTERM domain-containing protein
MTLLTLLGASPVLAATLTVNPDGGADYEVLQQAVDAAEDGDQIQVAGGEWGTVQVGGKDLSIDFGPSVATLNQLTVTEATLTLTGGIFNGEGAGIHSTDSSLTLEGVSFDGAQARSAALRADNSTVVASRISVKDWSSTDSAPFELTQSTVELTDAVFADTGGRRGGAIYAQGGSLSLSNVSVADSRAVEGGGALYLDQSNLLAEDVSLRGGQADSGGSIFATNNSVLDLRNVRITDSRARTTGGAMYLYSSNTQASDLVLTDNQAGQGGGIALDQGSLSIADLKSGANEARQEGGHFWVDNGASLTLIRSELSGGLATRGGGLFVSSGLVTARNAIWTGNEGAEVGGAYFQEDGSLDLRYGVLSGNSSELGSALAFAQGSANIEGLIFIDQRGGDSVVSASTQNATVSSSLFYESQNESFGSVNLVASLMDIDPNFVDGSWVPGPYSPALDALNGSMDLDNTPADMGAYGGPDAWALTDADGDGYTAGRDCDDDDDQAHENALDDYYDGVDADCRGNDDYDADGDGFGASQFGGLDCDDLDVNANPSMAEISGDRWDSNCDGLYDIDGDGDGWAEGVDCDDGDPESHPWADDVPYDGVDSDCLGNDDYDADGDGWPLSQDCDDQDAHINPSTPEIYDDGVDQDCDGWDAQESSGALADAEAGHTFRTEFPLIPDAGPGLDEAGMGGCSTAPGRGGALAGLLGMFGLLALRRRRL